MTKPFGTVEKKAEKIAIKKAFSSQDGIIIRATNREEAVRIYNKK